jgi:glycosyltransferase involved in cell wall biosynthesis
VSIWASVWIWYNAQESPVIVEVSIHEIATKRQFSDSETINTMQAELPVLGIVVPCFNEQAMLPITAKELGTKIDSLIASGLINAGSAVYFVDDGSSDKTWELIADFSTQNSRFHGIKLSRNYGHQYALYAGLMEAKGDCLISLDADLQDDIEVMDQMIIKYNEGSQIVYGVRSERSRDTWFKRWSASMHYRLASFFGIKALPDHADYRLMSRRAIDMLAQYRETNIYLRGVVPLLGLPSAVVFYKREERREGESKYGLKDMLGLSVQGITSFSIMPLRIISMLGMLVFFISVLLGGWALHAALTGNTAAIAGWASTVIPIYLLGGLQLLAIGIVGEYIGKTYMETKRRPLYQIEKTTNEL